MALSIPHSFVSLTVAEATEVNANFTAVKQFVDDLQTGTGLDSGAITAAKIETAAVTESKIASSAVTTTKIADGAVTAAKLAATAAIQPTIVDAKGDLIVATAADTVARLAVGTNGQVLTADSTQASGVKWASVPADIITAASGATVNTSQTTTSGSYTDLATSGPAVTLTTGTSVIVAITADVGDQDNANTGFFGASFAVSGATTRAAQDSEMIGISGAHVAGNPFATLTRIFVLTGLTAGSNTFTMKYKANGGTAGFANRAITVMSL